LDYDIIQLVSIFMQKMFFHSPFTKNQFSYATA